MSVDRNEVLREVDIDLDQAVAVLEDALNSTDALEEIHLSEAISLLISGVRTVQTEIQES
jgi:hypothetical protein